MKKLFVVLLGLILIQGCFATTIEGELFEWETLQKAEGVIIDVNSEPPQRVVAEQGAYEFEIGFGAYEIVAMQFVNGELARIARETLIVKSEGSFTIDLVLKQATEDDLAEIKGKGFEAELFNEQSDILPPSLGVVGGVLIVYILLLRRKRKKKAEGKNTEVVGVEASEQLDKYAMEVLDVLRRSGNRLTQKELRGKCESCGEAKISLVLAELEAMGKIKKIKKGRGNIIILKEI